MVSSGPGVEDGEHDPGHNGPRGRDVWLGSFGELAESGIRSLVRLRFVRRLHVGRWANFVYCINCMSSCSRWPLQRRAGTEPHVGHISWCGTAQIAFLGQLTFQGGPMLLPQTRQDRLPNH